MQTGGREREREKAQVVVERSVAKVKDMHCEVNVIKTIPKIK